MLQRCTRQGQVWSVNTILYLLSISSSLITIPSSSLLFVMSLSSPSFLFTLPFSPPSPLLFPPSSMDQEEMEHWIAPDGDSDFAEAEASRLMREIDMDRVGQMSSHCSHLHSPFLLLCFFLLLPSFTSLYVPLSLLRPSYLFPSFSLFLSLPSPFLRTSFPPFLLFLLPSFLHLSLYLSISLTLPLLLPPSLSPTLPTSSSSLPSLPPSPPSIPPVSLPSTQRMAV